MNTQHIFKAALACLVTFLPACAEEPEDAVADTMDVDMDDEGNSDEDSSTEEDEGDEPEDETEDDSPEAQQMTCVDLSNECCESLSYDEFFEQICNDEFEHLMKEFADDPQLADRCEAVAEDFCHHPEPEGMTACDELSDCCDTLAAPLDFQCEQAVDAAESTDSAEAACQGTLDTYQAGGMCT